ncbi:MAG: hypothetical protein ABIJ41_04150 [Candidatus Omnitrophota bacterium]
MQKITFLENFEKLKPKDKIQLGVTAGLVLVLIFVILSAVRGQKSRRPQGFFQNQNTPAEQSKTAGLYSRLEEETNNLQINRDPFFKKPQASTQESGLQLNGIAWEKGDPKAIINNKIVEIGSEINGHTVVNIKKDRVILNNGIRNIEILLEL